ncbi:YceI family protein [Flavihumibacter profundi]|uniref:YceI family protein n=1 Tax=Flavihumibacter profundi TaxID=2716883 RepID=UPI001CC6BA75|nr:YceI family protein [Flavihumibacter profundi]MBZ5858689.1 YceI family protein [Flavihumibacter profundi]
MKKITLALAFLALFSGINAQDKFFTKSGKIKFDATEKNSPENIEAVNKTVTCVLDTKTGNFQFAVLMKGFEFERALMQEHFHENYMESDKYPKSEFRGIVANNNPDNYTKNGSYDVVVKGKLTVHGETKDIETKGKMIVQNGNIEATANFPVVLADYKIIIPQLVADKLAKTASVLVDCMLTPLK